jgi:hypothetical protein
VKVFVNNEIRRFSFQGTSYASLCAQLETLAPLSNFAVKYQDEEGDWVTIASDTELAHAFELAGSQALRISVVDKAPIAPTFVPTVAASAPPAYDAVIPKKTVPADRKPNREEWKANKEAIKEMKRARKQEFREMKLKLREEKQVSKDLVARFVKHVSVPEYHEYAPGTTFTKTWRFRNEGTVPWPQGCNLIFVSKKGDIMGGPATIAIPKVVLPGEEIDVSANLIAPSQCGTYVGFWRLTEPSGRKFGQRVRVLIKVVDSSSSSSSDEDTEKIAWTQMLANLEAMGFHNKALNMKLLMRTNGDVNRVVAKLAKRKMRE